MEYHQMAKKEKRGAPKGNQRARKHGFYSKVLDEAEQFDLELAHGVDGIDDEIAVLRVKIKAILENDPENIKLIMEATNTLARLLRTRYNITKEQKKGLKEAIGNVLRDVAIPLGIGVATNLNK
jgi:16S rRNA C967 or C1407 C5-methylase (RsmB/RsmF family)